ncbi:MAG: s-methyl-5-thioribose-1-phosphate isomerase [Minisyncoccia bacterium]
MDKWKDLPILAKCAWLEGDEVWIVDETKLPHSLEYVKVKNFEDAAKAIEEMKTRAIGQILTVIFAMLLTSKQNSDKKPEKQLEILEKAAKRLGSARPTMNLRRPAERILGYAKEAYSEGKSISEELENRIYQYLDNLYSQRKKTYEVAANLVKDGYTILTHCNVSGGMVLLGRECIKQGKNIKFIVTETRPYFQGARLTAWELKEDGFPVTLITDNAVGYVTWKKMVNIAFAGADRCAMNGDIANKIGTYQIAIACFENDIPFYVFAYPDPNIPTGKDIPIEERDPKEVLYYKGIPISVEGINAYYPSFDVTPAKYIRGIVTSEGVFSPSQMEEVIKKVPPRY